MNIGFIGLGKMGSAIAGRLLEAGHALRVWNRSPEPARRLAERGAQLAASAEEAFRGDVVFSDVRRSQLFAERINKERGVSQAEGGVSPARIDLDLNRNPEYEKLRARISAWVDRFLIARVLSRAEPRPRGRAEEAAA